MPGSGLEPPSTGPPRRADHGERGGPHARRVFASHAHSPAEPEIADPDDLAQGVLDAMAAVRRTARRVSRRPALLSNLTGSQLELVRTVRRHPGISVADAAEDLRLAPNTVSTLVGQLIDAGIVVRTADRDDRRVAQLALAPAAARTVVDWYDRRTGAVASVIARLSRPDRESLQAARDVLSTVAAMLEADAAGAEGTEGRPVRRRPRRAQGESSPGQS